MINREELVLRTLLQPGECLIVNNHRVMHGRTSFVDAEGNPKPNHIPNPNPNPNPNPTLPLPLPLTLARTVALTLTRTFTRCGA